MRPWTATAAATALCVLLAASSSPMAGIVDVARVAGDTRIDTAVAVSARTFQTTDTVVLARADAYADALAGATLAGVLQAPVLLVDRGVLDQSVADEIARLHATTAVVLGGVAGIPDTIADQLRDHGVIDIRRLAGNDRFATAVAIAEEVGGNHAYLVEGADPDVDRGWPDALSASAIAAHTGRPILLATTDSLPDVTRQALIALGITRVTAIGGTAAMSEAVLAAAADPDGDGDQEVQVDRIAGTDRYDTSRLVAEAAVAAGLEAEQTWHATGRGWPDALAAGPAAAAAGGPLLLIDGAVERTPAVEQWYREHPVRTAVLVGGTAVIGALAAGWLAGLVDGPSGLADVQRWYYVLDVNLDEDHVSRIEQSTYDMVVVDFIPSEANNTDYPMAQTVARWHDADHPKLVLAYIDVGEAESYRTYWEPGWRVGDPEWILTEDPDGWAENYPVAYWWDEWQAIWLGDGGLIDQIVEAGFDGIYLDWIEGYSDTSVQAFAEQDGVNARQEMLWWIEDLASHGRLRHPGFLVIGQNAVELASTPGYLDTVDGMAVEQIWFDGAADDQPPGDCPLPRTEADVDTQAYVDSLSPGCRQLWEDYPESTLHTSSEWYLGQLAVASAADEPIFTVDYALDPDNVTWVYDTSRGLGFVPFTSNRALDTWREPVP